MSLKPTNSSARSTIIIQLEAAHPCVIRGRTSWWLFGSRMACCAALPGFLCLCSGHNHLAMPTCTVRSARTERSYIRDAANLTRARHVVEKCLAMCAVSRWCLGYGETCSRILIAGAATEKCPQSVIRRYLRVTGPPLRVGFREAF